MDPEVGARIKTLIEAIGKRGSITKGKKFSKNTSSVDRSFISQGKKRGFNMWEMGRSRGQAKSFSHHQRQASTVSPKNTGRWTGVRRKGKESIHREGLKETAPFEGRLYRKKNLDSIVYYRKKDRCRGRGGERSLNEGNQTLKERIDNISAKQKGLSIHYHDMLQRSKRKSIEAGRRGYRGIGKESLERDRSELIAKPLKTASDRGGK